MKDWIWCILISAVVCAIFVPLLIFTTEIDMYAVKNPTQEQVEALIEGDPSNRVWFDDAAQLYQGSSLIKISFRARAFEGERIKEFLNKVGVDYILLKEDRR